MLCGVDREVTRNVTGKRAAGILRQAGVVVGAAGLLLATACGAAPAGTVRAAAMIAQAAKARTWWHPTDSGPNNGPEFQWELDHALNVHSTSDMGTGAL